MAEAGAFTVSLDFELHWGSRDHRPLAAYREQLLGGRSAVPRLLDVFGRYGIHATWATVGLMFFENREELLQGLPGRKPAYSDASLNPYEDLAELGNGEVDDPFHYAPSLIREIARRPNQEIATHTFSHYYCLERGQTLDDFSADLETACGLARRKLGIEIRSIVFPRNQFDESYVKLCAAAGLTVYRGNPNSWVYEPRARDEERLTVRAVRLLDSYVNLTGHHGHARYARGSRPENQQGSPVNVPASRFLRSSSRRLAPFEQLRLKRIRDDMSYCAQNGLLYHLWWHPDNFGTRQSENFEFLEGILCHYARLREEKGMQSLNMSEAGLWMIHDE